MKDGTQRFFAAPAMAGRLYIQGVDARGPWNPRHLVYWTEAQVEAYLQSAFRGPKGPDASRSRKGARTTRG